MYDAATNPDPRTLDTLQVFDWIYKIVEDNLLHNQPLPEGFPHLDTVADVIGVNKTGVYWSRSQFESMLSKISSLSESTGNRFLDWCYLTTAVWLVNRTSGTYQKLLQPMTLELDAIRTKDPATVFSLTILTRWIDREDFVLVTTSDGRSDSDYAMHRFLSQSFGLLRSYTLQEKLDHFPFPMGSVVSMFVKKGQLTDAAPWGNIDNQMLVKICDLDHERGKILLQNLRVNGTYENVVKDFFDLPDDNRLMFRDILNFAKPETPRWHDLRDFGLNLAMFNETYLLCELTSEKSPVWINAEGSLRLVEMSERDIAYWCLSQRDIDFDKEAFKSFYELPDPLWDSIGCSISPSYLKSLRSSFNTPEDYEDLAERIGYQSEEWF